MRHSWIAVAALVGPRRALPCHKSATEQFFAWGWRPAVRRPNRRTLDQDGDQPLSPTRIKPRTAGAAMSQNKASPLLGCALFGFFGLFFSAGCIAFFFTFVRPAFQVFAAAGWAETPCVIKTSEVRTHSDSDGTTYSVHMEFEYFVNGERHRSDRYSFSTVSSGSRAGKQRIVDRYPAGSETVCYVDPDDPTAAVINRDFDAGIWFGLFPLIFVAVGLGGFVFAGWAVRRHRRRGVKSTTEWLPDDEQRRVERQPQRGYLPSHVPGPVTLKPEASRWGTLAFAVFFALFWNGITSIFVVHAVASHIQGKPDWFLTFFIIPFVLVGLGVILFVGYSLLALFTPQPVVTVSSRLVRLGETLRLSWSFGGNARAIRELKISIRGREEATYRRGTDTITDTRTFYELAVLDTSDFVKIQRGDAEVTIPKDTVHSFESKHNKIVWTVHVKGEILNWPDVDNSYSLLVLPLENA